MAEWRTAEDRNRSSFCAYQGAKKSQNVNNALILMLTSTRTRILFHGTTLSRIKQYNPIEGELLTGFSIDLEKCRERTDFSRGFYLTTSLKQAKNWANNLVGRVAHSSNVDDKAAVLEFSIPLELMAKLESLWFVVDNRDFVRFVSGCRRGGNHERITSDQPYDMVSGPVTLFPQEMVVKDCDQVSFHTPAAISLLSAPKLVSIGTTIRGQFRSSYVN